MIPTNETNEPETPQDPLSNAWWGIPAGFLFVVVVLWALEELPWLN